METSILYILCGLPGSGKTTYAKKLEQENVVRLSLDEELFKTYGKDFPPEKYSEFEKAIKSHLLNKASNFLKEGISVSLDWGFWKKQERENLKRFALENLAKSKLIYFKKDFSKLVDAVSNRDMTHNHSINPEMLEIFAKQFEEPEQEGEEVIEYTN